MVLDTDTFNEVDDQFAVTHALLSPESMRVEAIYAAPYYKKSIASAGAGMELSYQEILQLLQRLAMPADGLVYRGAAAFMADATTPVQSAATDDLIARAMATDPDDGPLYVVAIGAITNVASAILLEPTIIERIVVVWLGGHALYWPSAREFNLSGDPHAARVLFDCGVALLQLPCWPVVSHLLTNIPELERYVEPCGAIGAFLTERVKSYHAEHKGWGKEIWDLAATAYLVNPAWIESVLVPSPILTTEETWSVDQRRHLIRTATKIKRDAIFRDFFDKLAAFAAPK
jgi:inosine-uridine nucleoside N-ribohydrolase